MRNLLICVLFISGTLSGCSMQPLAEEKYTELEEGQKVTVNLYTGEVYEVKVTGVSESGLHVEGDYFPWQEVDSLEIEQPDGVKIVVGVVIIAGAGYLLVTYAAEILIVSVMLLGALSGGFS